MQSQFNLAWLRYLLNSQNVCPTQFRHANKIYKIDYNIGFKFECNTGFTPKVLYSANAIAADDSAAIITLKKIRPVSACLGAPFLWSLSSYSSLQQMAWHSGSCRIKLILIWQENVHILTSVYITISLQKLQSLCRYHNICVDSTITVQILQYLSRHKITIYTLQSICRYYNIYVDTTINMQILQSQCRCFTISIDSAAKYL